MGPRFSLGVAAALGSGCLLPALALMGMLGVLGAGAATAGLTAVSGLAPEPGGYTLPVGVEIGADSSSFPSWAQPCGPEPGALALQPSACTGRPAPFPANYQGFATGQCTWYVATRRMVFWHDAQGQLGGNAGQWLQLAQAAGLAVGSQPEVGSIAVYQDQGAGHVALVVGVAASGDYTVAEANWLYFGPVAPYVDLRGVAAGSTGSSQERLEGFIYGPGGADN